ncbi:hypothetical protein ACFL1T_01720 [Chlamydiota bacterium]
MKSVPKGIKFVSFINLLIGIVLLILKIPYGLLGLLIFAVLFIQKPWARSFVLGLFSVIIFISVLMIFISVAVGDTISYILSQSAISLVCAIVYFSFFSLLHSSENIKRFYLEKSLIPEKDEQGKDDWLCPQCNVNNKFSIRCWNCSFSKDMLDKKKSDKPPDKISQDSEQKEDPDIQEESKKGVSDKSDKINSYIKKKKKENN